MMRTSDADGLRGMPRVPGTRVSTTPARADAGIRSRLDTGAATDPLDGDRGRLERVCRGAAGEGEHRG